jgi:cysteine desulfurase family protein (TIGR01976 family)
MADRAVFRAAFPALSRLHNGHPVAYFDGPGGTQVPTVVVDAMSDYLLHHNANTDWAYPTSAETDVIIAGARAAMADFVGGNADEIAFGANMTTLTFHVSRALGRAWGPSDTIVVTELDHHANIDPWLAVARERGVRVEHVRLDPATGELDDADLARALARSPRLVAVTAASNALGTMPDVASIADRAHAAGALVFVDAVHGAPHVLPDVQAMGADFLACSAYKFYGPHIGVLWGRRALLEGLDVPKVRPAHDNAPDRVETGTLNHEGIAGAAAVVDFLASFGAGASRRERLASAYRAWHAESAALFAVLWDGLGSIPGVTRYGPPPSRPRSPTVSFSVRGLTPRAVASRLAPLGVFVSHGDFYAATVAERLVGGDGFVRAGICAYNTRDEVERLLAGVRELGQRATAGQERGAERA